TDPLDAALNDLFSRNPPTAKMAEAVFDIAGFAIAHPERQRLIEFVATHLVHFKQGGPKLAFAALGIGNEPPRLAD
ncbi:MAG: mannitol dehydrogenase family protein, partial [Mesorhizobium sp.]